MADRDNSARKASGFGRQCSGPNFYLSVEPPGIWLGERRRMQQPSCATAVNPVAWLISSLSSSCSRQINTKTSTKGSQRIRWNVMVCSNRDTYQGFPWHRVALQNPAALSESSKKSFLKKKRKRGRRLLLLEFSENIQTLGFLSVQSIDSILSRFEFAFSCCSMCKQKKYEKMSLLIVTALLFIAYLNRPDGYFRSLFW